MLLKHWLMALQQEVRSKFSGRRDARSRRLFYRNAPAQTEVLEDRTLLTPFIVDTLDDVVATDGRVSLREAVLAANGNSPVNEAPMGMETGDTIAFAASIAGGTIVLTGGQLEITDDLVIDGETNAITISGNGAFRIFSINTAADEAVSLSNLSLTAGNTAGSTGDDGGAIFISDSENVTLDSVTITNSIAAGRGGAIFAGNGTLTLTNSQIGNEVVESDVWSSAVDESSGEQKVFAFVDDQNSTMGLGTILTVFNDDGTLAAEPLNPVVAGLDVTMDGSIFFEVEGIFDAVAPYEIYSSVVNDTPVSEAEPNGDSGTATGISEDTLIAGSLADTTDEDFFSITLGADEDTLVVMLDNDPNGVGITDAVIDILDTNGTSVLSSSLFAGSEFDAAIADGLTGGATYFVRISSGGGTAGAYEFVAKAVDSAASPTGDRVSESEPNDNLASADVLTASQFGQGNLDLAGGNLAVSGGGIFINGGTLNLDFTAVNNNMATGGSSTQGGGGIASLGGTITIDDSSTVSFNRATGASGSGGGILASGGLLTIIDSSITDNTAARAGGGLETQSTISAVTATITNANVSNNVVGSTPGNGGGLHVTSPSGSNATNITITGGNFSANSAAAEGGGIWNDVTGTITINGVNIDNNIASGAASNEGGGGVFNSGGRIIIQNNQTTATSISGNIANGAAGSGGGILNDGGTLTITGATITGNSAVRAGGGIEATTSASRNSIATLTNVTISSNTAGSTPGNGGGVHISDAAGGNTSTFTIRGGSITGNSAAAEGGGLWNDIGGTMTIRGVSITGNTASGNSAGEGGGGVFNNGGTVNIRNFATTVTTISNNIANGTMGSGGGILNDGGTLQIQGAVIDSNSAVLAGGGIEATTASTRDSEVTLSTTTISGNTAQSGAGVHITDAAGTNQSELSIIGGLIAGNSAASEGGGLWNDIGGTVLIGGATISDNTASGAASDQGGGGIYNNGGSVSIGNFFSLALGTTFISDNIASGASGSGGGILNDGGTLEIDGAVIDGNSAVRAGGGIEVTTASTRDSIVEVTNSSISNNVAGGNPGNGGGVHISDTVGGNTSTFTISDSDVIGNSAAAEGGGLWNAAGGTMNIDGVLILSNTASGNNSDQGGGGIFNEGGTINITNTSGATQILANFANGTSGSGGGILNDGGTLNITGATISSNAAVRAGGGIEATTANGRDSIVALTNTVISTNEVADNPGNGGGVHISDAAAGNTSTFTITGGSVMSNSAAAEGGGLWNDVGGTMTINGVSIGSNTASGVSADQGGGGVFNNGGTIIIQNNTTTATTISGNIADGAAGSGGGILNDGGTLTITGALITGNSAVRAGGGIEATSNSRNSIVTVTDSTISTNTAGSSPGNGGGVHVTDVVGGNTSSFTLTGGTVTGNSAASEGGGLWNAAGGTMIIDGTTISGNTASGSSTSNGGGGIFNDGGMLTITAATIMGNIANGATGNGGGIFNEAGGNLTITETTINNNSVQGTTTTGGTGGGIFNLGTLTITDSTLSANSVNNAGGGIWNSGTLDAVQVTISGNTAATNGGGVFAGGSGTVDILNSTLTNNQALGGTGGGIANGGTASVFLESTIVAENVQATATPSDINGAVLSTSQFNLVGISTGLTGITDGTNNNLVGTPASPIDPLLGPLADNGGPTFTHIPLPGSPAVNAGSNPDELDFDQRGDGFDRTIGPETDIGSVEAQINLLVVGSGLGDSRVRIYDSSTGALITTLSPYGTGFLGAIRTAVADVNGDGSLDLITGAGPGGGPHVKVFSGADNFTTELFSFFAFDAAFMGGVYVAAANFNPLEDDNADIVVSADAGAGPHVIVFNGTNLSPRQSFFAFGGGFAGGVRVATGDISGDGIPDIITAAGPGAGPHVRVFNGATSQFTETPLDISQTLMNPAGSFFAYGGFAGGVFVASGDINGDGRDDIITGAGAGAGPHVRVFSGMNGAELFSFFAFDPNFVGGVTVGSVQGPDGDGVDDIVVGPGPGGGPVVRVFTKDSIPNSVLDFFAFEQDFIGGIFVSGASSGPSLLTSPLLFGGGPIADDAATLSQAQLDTLVGAAIQRLESTGASSSAIEALAAVDVRAGDLAEGVLGLSLGGTILIDADASGAGWFIDPTPGDDAEFDANLNALDPATVGRVDLLTVLLHEFGHELGSDDLGILDHPENLMAESLTTGKRRLPNEDLDAFFSDGNLLETALS